MINHGRTLLLNQAAADASGYASVAGEEFVPPEFSPLVLPSHTQQIRRVLFGSDPSRLCLNFRARQLLPILHATELVEFLTALDPRITYDCRRVDTALQEVFQFTVTPLGHASPLYLQGEAGAADATGRTLYDAGVRITDDDALEITQEAPQRRTSVAAFTVQDGLSSRVTLPDSGLSFRLAPAVGRAWRIRGYLRPQRTPAELLTLLQRIGDGTLETLFGVASGRTGTEPGRTFYNLWSEHPDGIYRLGGLLLALIYDTERVRRG